MYRYLFVYDADDDTSSQLYELHEYINNLNLQNYLLITSQTIHLRSYQSTSKRYQQLA